MFKQLLSFFKQKQTKIKFNQIKKVPKEIKSMTYRHYRDWSFFLALEILKDCNQSECTEIINWMQSEISNSYDYDFKQYSYQEYEWLMRTRNKNV